MDSKHVATHGSALISSCISCAMYIFLSGLNAEFFELQAQYSFAF